MLTLCTSSAAGFGAQQQPRWVLLVAGNSEYIEERMVGMVEASTMFGSEGRLHGLPATFVPYSNQQTANTGSS